MTWVFLFQINNDSEVVLHTNGHKRNFSKQDFPNQAEDLVKWAKQKFGGVTSFTTIRNLKNIALTEAEGENCV